MQTALQRIHYIDALAGAGKTFAIVRRAHEMVERGAKVVIVQPSRLLINRTVEDELSKYPEIPHRVIHGETDPSVIAEIVRHLKECGDKPELLFITQAAFFQLPFFANRKRWTVILDEVPQIDDHDEFNLPDNHDLLFPHLRVEDVDGCYGLVMPNGDTGLTALARIAKNQGKDDVFKLLSGFAGRVTSEHWDVHVLNTQAANIETGPRDLRRLQAFSILRPSSLDGFGSVIIAGACFKDTLLYQLWDAQRVQFKAMKLPLRYTTHANGHLLTIKYVTEEPWSKALRDRSAGGGLMATIAVQVRASILAEAGAHPFLWMGNKDVPDDFFGSHATRLPNTPHGLNTFQDHHTTVVYSALNPSGSHFSFLGKRGIDSEAVRTALYRQATYQAVMRSSLRNPTDHTPKLVVVMDRATADWLAQKFPGAVVQALGGSPLASVLGKPGRPRVHASDYDRKAAHWRQKERELLIEQGTINGDDLMSGITRIPVFEDKFAAEAFAHLDYGNDDEFIANLRDLHSNAVPSKESAGLLSPAFFDPSLSQDTSRGLANIKHLRGIWLDNDGGDLTSDEFARLFPSLRVVISNTYSSTPEKPRWRAFIPTTEAMSLSVYRLILGQIFSDLNGAGFWSAEQLEKNKAIKRRQAHGFDMSKLNGASLFYLPAQAAHPFGSFFQDHAGPARKALEPVTWIKRAIRTSKVPPAAASGSTSKQPAKVPQIDQSGPQASRVEKAIAAWTSVNQQVGQGHAAFYRLALSLRSAGLDARETADTLYDQAIWARNPSERRDEIPRIVRKLWRSGPNARPV